MPSKSKAAETSQELMSWLNLESENISRNDNTFETSHGSGWSKLDALVNMDSIVVTADVFQELIG